KRRTLSDGVVAPATVSGGVGGDGRLVEEGEGEGLGVEVPQVLDPLADPDVADGDPELVSDPQDDPPLGRAVELGENDAGDRHDLGEHRRLSDAVLTAGGVVDQP